MYYNKVQLLLCKIPLSPFGIKEFAQDNEKMI